MRTGRIGIKAVAFAIIIGGWLSINHSEAVALVQTCSSGICSTFCPSNPEEYCTETLGCGYDEEDYSCPKENCLAAPFTFPRTIYCLGE